MANTQQELARAFELIRQDSLAEAVSIVRPITETEPDNADAWWLLANAASEPRDARRALVTVLKINPRYPKARDLLDMLNEAHPPRDDELMLLLEVPEPEDTSLPVAAPTPQFIEEEEDEEPTFVTSSRASAEIDDLFGDAPSKKDPFAGDDDFGLPDDVDPFAELLADDGKKERRARRGRGGCLRRILLLLLILIIIGGAAGYFLMNQDQAEDDTPLAALTPVTADAINAENAQFLEDVRTALERDAVAQFGNQTQAIFIQRADANALLVQICAEPSPNLPQTAVSAMSLTAQRVGNTTAIHPDLALVGVNIVDCSRGDDVLYRALSPLQAAIDYNNSGGTRAALSAFRAAWQVES